ncbi:MAG: FAD:protein FMN transferase [Ktedonobacterales bacterium]
MGTSVELLLPRAVADSGGALVVALFAEWERVLSRFLTQSELSRLNARAGNATEVSPLLLRVLQAALRAAAATGGVYDPTLLGQIIAVGYTASFDTLPRMQAALAAHERMRPGGGWRDIAVEAAARRVTLPRGVGLDFGGIAKGMAVDASIARLREAGIACALVNAGGDLAVWGLPPEHDAWPIAMPGRAAGEWGTLSLARGALATSGVARRHWRQGALARHHLLDPLTGAPAASDLWSATVVAGDCAQAEVAAKVAFILGATRGAAFLEAHQLPGLLVRDDGSRLPAGPWPEEIRWHAASSHVGWSDDEVLRHTRDDGAVRDAGKQRQV